MVLFGNMAIRGIISSGDLILAKGAVGWGVLNLMGLVPLEEEEKTQTRGQNVR